MKTSEFLEITAGGESQRPNVKGMAYGGGKMKLSGWKHPIVVDLEGMSIPDSVPLLTNHENLTSSRVGMVTASVNENTLLIAGEILAEDDKATGIVNQAKAGADWQLSIGADVEVAELVKANTTVNNQEIDAPFYHIKKSTLREVSVVAVGADSSTRLKVTAAFNLTPKEETSMSDELVVKAERERVMKIKAICSGEFPKIEEQAIESGWTPEKTSEQVLASYRAKQPETSLNVLIKTQPETNRKTLEAAMCLRCGISNDIIEKSYDEKTIDAGMVDMDMPLRQLLIECMRLDGISYSRGFDNETIRAAFSSVSLPGILSNVANKKLLQSYQAQPVIATKLCSTGDLNDFKENDRFRLTDVGDLLPVAPDGEIKDGGLIEDSAKNQLETYGKKFCLTRKMIINDDLGAFMKVPAAMGNRAARLIDQLFFSRLLENPNQSDGKALFNSAHNNLLTGATSALSSDSLKKGIQLFLDQVDGDGQPISVEPRFLLVPTALKHLAIELTQGATLIMSGGSNNSVRPALNVIADENLQVISSPYLGNTAYSGNSQTGWYLLGNPQSVDTFELGFLKGRRTPTIERGETDFNTLGMWFRVYFDIGVREQDYRGMIKANGVA